MKEEFKQLRKQSLLKTKEKRKTQRCRVFELKLDSSHLSKEKKEYLKRLFLEAKWFYNAIVASKDVFKFDTGVKKVIILNKDEQKEERELKFLSSQMKGAILDRCQSSIKTLNTRKNQGLKIGKLKFKSKVSSVPLKQFGITYKLKKNYLIIQKFKKSFKIQGLDQIPKDADLANANLVSKPSGYYLKATCFTSKEEKVKTGKMVGLDFGIKDSIVDSNGNKYNFQFPESKRIKKISKQFTKSNKGSRKRTVLYGRLQKAYEKNSNIKKDAKVKFISKLVKNNDFIVIQDENIHAWHKSKMKGFGRRIQHGIMGGIISGLKTKSETFIVSKFFPSTQLCPKCGSLNKHGLGERVYNCSCGYSCDRDIHSARNILKEGLRLLNMEHIKTILDEKKAPTSKSNVDASKYLMTPEAING